MKPLGELINPAEPGWPVVKAMLDKANKPVEVLDVTLKRAGAVLHALQVTTRSPMGAIAFQTGGLLVDHGWVRVLGGGCARFEGDLARWNGLTPAPLVAKLDGAMFVAHDVLGGFYALDGGALGEGKGGAYYLAPDTLEWENLERGYSDLIAWLLMGDLQKFYGDHRWEGWEKDVAALSPDRGYAFDPPLFTEEGKANATRKEVPMPELLAMNLELMSQG